MEVRSGVLKTKQRPAGYLGYITLIIPFDSEWGFEFIGEVRHTFYSLPQECADLREVVWKTRENGKWCRYVFVSYQRGDNRMVKMIEAKYRLARNPDRKWKTQNAFWLKQVTNDLPDPVELMIRQFQARQYTLVLETEKTIDDEFQGFAMFMRILATMRILVNSNDETHRKSLESYLQEYYAFHHRVNGKTSTQLAYAALLGITCLRRTSECMGMLENVAKRYLPDSESLFSLTLGHRAFTDGNYTEALALYRRQPFSYYGRILHRLLSKGLWHHAFGFAFIAASRQPVTEFKEMFAQCAYAVGMKSTAIHYLGYENRTIMKTWSTSEFRVCESCWDTNPIERMLCCLFCNESWYCNITCYTAFGRWHHCRTCAVCWTYIKDKHVLRCPGCYLRIYCSSKCQNEDWYDNDHKSQCK